MKRTPLRRRGAVTRRYEKVRQTFLGMIFDQSPQAVTKSDGTICQTFSGAAVGATGNVVYSGIGDRGALPILRRPDGHLVTTAHVHHSKKRSTHPGLRNDVTNLILLSEADHRKIHVQ